MAIDMTTVKKITMPGHLYKKTIYLNNNDIIYKGTSNPCPVEITIYSKTPLTTTITASNLSSYLASCGYTAYNGRYRLIVDNPYEFIYNNGTYDCVFASCQIIGANSVYVFFSVPGTTSTVSVARDWTITEDPWQEVGSYPAFIYDYKTRIVSTGSYTNFTVGKNYITGDEYIANYCIDGVSYPDVTIVSVSGNEYTLSNQEVITVNDYSSTFDLGKEVIKIQDSNDVVIWEKPIAGYYIKHGNYYINKGASGSLVTSSTTPETVWQIESDNRVSCIFEDTKYYLQYNKEDQYEIYGVRAYYTLHTGYDWCYKNGNYITGTINGSTWYLYRNGGSASPIRMRTTPTTLTFKPVYQ